MANPTIVFAALAIGIATAHHTFAATLQIGDPALNVGATSFDFFPPGGGTGSFKIGDGVTGSFAGLTGTSGTIQDLSLLAQPVNTPLNLANFITFAAAPTLRMDLTGISAGVGALASCFSPAATGQTCTPVFPALITASNPLGQSPLTLANTKTGSIMSIDLRANAVNGGTGATSPAAGVVTAQFAGQSYQQVLETIVSGGTVNASFSATVSASAGATQGKLQVGQPTLAVSLAGIDFLPFGGSAGSFAVGPTSSGAFGALFGSSGAVKDLSFAALNVNGTTALDNFLTFSAAPLLEFDVDFVHSGGFGLAQCFAPPAVGQTCTPTLAALITPDNPLGQTPFSFMNTANGSVLAFEPEGIVHDFSTLTDIAFTGLFTAQFDVHYQFILEQLFNGQSVVASYSASFDAQFEPPTRVPEPASLGLMLCGAIWLVRRVQRDSSKP
jgi:hypothetical protein